jgi:hypothetical protein
VTTSSAAGDQAEATIVTAKDRQEARATAGKAPGPTRPQSQSRPRAAPAAPAPGAAPTPAAAQALGRNREGTARAVDRGVREATTSRNRSKAGPARDRTLRAAVGATRFRDLCRRPGL